MTPTPRPFKVNFKTYDVSRRTGPPDKNICLMCGYERRQHHPPRSFMVTCRMFTGGGRRVR